MSTSRLVLKLLRRHVTGVRRLGARGAGARGVVLAGFLILFGTVMAAEYVFFRGALQTLGELGLAGAALTLYLIESTLVLVFLIALVSFVASGLWMYYRSRDTRLLMATPLPLGGLYALRSLETFALTSWALVVVGVPALFALGTAYGHDAGFYLAGTLVLVAFATLTGGVGALLTTLAGAALRRAPTRRAAAGLVVLLLVVFMALIGRNVVPSTADFHAVFDPGMLNGKPASIKFIEAKFGLWPSHPFAAALYTRATGGHAGSSATELALWLAPLAALAVAATLGRTLFARTLPAVAETFVLTGSRPRRAGAARFPRWLSGPVGAMIERDVVTVLRNPHEWSRAAFLALLLLIYSTFIIAAPLRAVGDQPEAVARLLFFTVLAAGYFLTAFGLRFVFPAISLEGRVAWVFFSSPIRKTPLVAVRATLSTLVLAAAVVPIAMLSVVRLVSDPALIAASAAVLVLVAATTTTVLLTAGAAWPDFRESNAEALSTTGSGLGGTVVCLVYVAAMGWITRRAAFDSASGAGVVGWLAVAALASAVVIAAALALAHRRMQELEAP